VPDRAPASARAPLAVHAARLPAGAGRLAGMGPPGYGAAIVFWLTPMILIWGGFFLIVLKLLEVGPFGAVSWWWVAAPFAAALIWFEFLEGLLGFDRRGVDREKLDRARKERVAARFRVSREERKAQKRDAN
jgi:small Trp-rich protein